MAQNSPETYAWIAGIVLGLIAALKLAIGKITGGRKDPLSEVLQHDLDAFRKDFEDLKRQAKEDRELIVQYGRDLAVIKDRLKLDGDQR